MTPRRKRNHRSTSGELLYRVRYGLAGYALRSFVAAMGYVPHRFSVPICTFWATVTHRALWRYRIRMEENIALAAGTRFVTRAERKDLVWRAWKNFARGVLETAAAVHYPKEKITRMVRLEGEEHLQQALRGGKGVLALSAHLGNFTLIGARLAAAGYPFSVVVKHPGDKRFAQLITRFRAKMGIETIPAKPRREAVRCILKALRANRVVLVIADEFKSGDVLVEFMGQKLPAPRGPATLALRTGAVTLPMFALRSPDDNLVLAVGPAIDPVRRDDLEASIRATTGLYTRYLEEVILRHPDQWNWLGFPRRDRTLHAATPRRAVAPRRTRTDQQRSA